MNQFVINDEIAREKYLAHKRGEKMLVIISIKKQKDIEKPITELDKLIQKADADKQDEADVDEYIRRLKSYAGAEELTRQMYLDLIEYFTVDAYQVSKPLANGRNPLLPQNGMEIH